MPVAILLSAVLLLIAVLSIRSQFTQLRQLRTGPMMADEDRRYFRNRCRRRILNGLIMVALAAMLSGSYLSGIEARANQMAADADAARQAQIVRELSPEELEFRKFYSLYWIGILGLLFLIMTVADVDFWATYRYARSQLKRIREDQQAMLRRDLEMYKQQKINDRMRPNA